MLFIFHIFCLIDTVCVYVHMFIERADEADRKLVEAENGKAKAEKELADMVGWLAEAEKNLATAKNDLSDMEKLLVHSTNRLVETESKLIAAERRVSELEQKSAFVDDANQNKVSNRVDGDRENVAAVDGAACDVIDVNQCCVQAVK